MECLQLMIVVAIIGILAAIAIPQYQNYIAKSQVSRVMGELGALKTAYETCINDGKTAIGECDLGFNGSNLVSLTAPAVTTAGTAPTVLQLHLLGHVLLLVLGAVQRLLMLNTNQLVVHNKIV